MCWLLRSSTLACPYDIRLPCFPIFAHWQSSYTYANEKGHRWGGGRGECKKEKKKRRNVQVEAM